MQISQIYYRWGELEKKRGDYNWNDIDYNISVSAKQGLKSSVIIKIIDTEKIGDLPDDIRFTAFSDSAVKARFSEFILTLLKRHSNNITYLWIGNEIDDYLYTHRDQARDYFGFYEHVYKEIKAKYPSLNVGTISTYHDAKNNRALDIIKEIGAKGDLIGFSLYPQMIKPKTDKTETYFHEMSTIAKALKKKFAVTETAWSSGGYGGSEEGQKRYIKELFTAYRQARNDMEYLGLFNLYDFPDSVNRSFMTEFGISNAEFSRWLGSLGLARNDGTPKEAWNAFLKEMGRSSK